MVRTIFKVRPHGGIVSDISAAELDPNFYSQGQNVVFRNGYAERAGGYAEVIKLVPVVPYHIRCIKSPTSQAWVVCGSNEVWVHDGTSWKDITPTGGLIAVNSTDDWTSTELNGVAVFNNSINPPFYYTNVSSAVCPVLPGWPANTTCRAIRAFKFYLFALNITGPGGRFGSQLLWSDAAGPGEIPGTWDPLVTNQAGSDILSATPGDIIDAAPLRGQLMVYKEGSTYIGQYIGGTYVMSFRKLFVTSGALARNCITEVFGKQYVLSDGDFLVTDGTQIVSAIDGKNREYLFSNMDYARRGECWVSAFNRFNEIWIGIPIGEGGEFCSKAFVFDHVANAWGVRDLPNVSAVAQGEVGGVSEAWDTDAEAWDADASVWNAGGDNGSVAAFIAAGIGPALWSLDASNSWDGEGVPAFIEAGDIDADIPDSLKVVRRVYPRFRVWPVEGCFVSVGSSGQRMGQPVYTPEVLVESGQQAADICVTGRYLSVKFRTFGTSGWQLDGFDLEIDKRGYF